jgi:undecaprenyl-diphosphatase
LIFDVTLSQHLTISPKSGGWRWARLVAHLGDGTYVFGALGLAYLLGWLWSHLFLRRAAFTVAVIVILTIVVVTLIKFFIRRERPRPPGEFVTFQYDLYSFPSGHSARMAALAVGTIFFYAPLGWILVTVTLAIATARVLVGVHYLGDVIVGLCTGVLVAWPGMLLLLYLF